MRVNKFAIFAIFSALVFSFSLAPAQSLPTQSQYPVYEGVCSDTKSFEEKIKLGSSYTRLSSQSGSFLEKAIWESQKELKDEIYDALGSYRISAELVDKEFNVAGRELWFNITPALYPERVVRVVNNRGNENVQTRYMVSDRMDYSTTLSTGTPVNGTIGLEFYKGQTSLGIQRISYVNSLEQYNNDRPASFLSRYIDNSKSYDDYIRSMEKEHSKVFFKGFFDPFRVGKNFIKISAEKVKNDPTFKKGDILIKNLFRRQGPGIGASKGLARAGVNKFRYEEVKIGLKKEDNNKYLLKVQYENGKDWNPYLKVGIPITGYHPHRTSYNSITYTVKEKLYRVDLNNLDAQDQLDRLLNNFATDIDPSEYYDELIAKIRPIPGVFDELFEKNRESLTPQTILRNKTELGILGFRSIRSKSLEGSEIDTTDGAHGEHAIGEIQRYSSSRIRLKFLESNEDSKKRFRILTRKMADGSLETDLGFEYSYDDSRTSVREYYKYLTDVNNALFLDKHVQGTQAQKLSDLIKDRLNNKSRSKDQQALSAALYFSQRFVRKIASKNVEDVKKLIARMFLGTNSTWENLEKLKRSSGSCSSRLNPDYKDAVLASETSCSALYEVAVKLVQTFETAKKAKYKTVTQNFTELVSDQKMRPIIPMLMLKIGLFTEFDQRNEPIFASLDDAFNNGDVEMNMAFVGDGIDGIIYEQVGDVANLTPATYEGDFPLITPIASTPLIIKSEVATDGQKLYLQFDSLVKAQESYVLKGVVSKYRLIRNDRVQAVVKVRNLTSTDILAHDGNVSFFRYVVELPMIKEIARNSDSVIQFWIEDSGSRITEPFSAKFNN